MSIFGERIRRPWPGTAGDLSDYAKKDYFDSQDGLRVLKAGDTMTGDLTMRAQSRVRGLPTSKTGPRLQGDEAVSQFETVEVIGEALKHFRKTIKPLITVWAENKRSMVYNRYEWSFGRDAARGYSNGGYPMLTAGRVLRMGLSTTASHSGISDAGVNISVNGKEKKSYGATRFPGQISGVSIFEIPLELVQGDTINFKSATHNPKIAGATVSLLIELDL